MQSEASALDTLKQAERGQGSRFIWRRLRSFERAARVLIVLWVAYREIRAVRLVPARPLLLVPLSIDRLSRTHTRRGIGVGSFFFTHTHTHTHPHPHRKVAARIALGIPTRQLITPPTNSSRLITRHHPTCQVALRSAVDSDSLSSVAALYLADPACQPHSFGQAEPHTVLPTRLDSTAHAHVGVAHLALNPSPLSIGPHHHRRL